MADAAGWAADHGAGLLGRPAGQAAAEAGAAGFRTRVAGPAEVLTLEFRPDRLTLLTDADGVVVEVRPG